MEVDVCFFYDMEVIIVKVCYLIGEYVKVGIDKKCILIKIVFIWEGIKVVEVLE